MIEPAAELSILLRLGAATLIGAAIGLNRDLHGKPTGVRTLGLVGLGAWTVAVVALVFVLALLALGGPLEGWVHRKWARDRGDGSGGGENRDGS